MEADFLCKVFLKRLVITIQERLDKKCMKFLCGLVENVCDNTLKVDYVIPETNYTWDKCLVGWCSLLLVTQFNTGVFGTQTETLQ